MLSKPRSLAQRLAHKLMLLRWRKAAAGASGLSLSALRDLQASAMALREPMDEVSQLADLRLTRPRPGAQAIAQKPSRTDWAWRPEAWCQPLRPHALAGMASKDKIGHEITLFHDCALRELTLRQMRNRSDEDLAPFSLRLEAMGFHGSFLSLALDLPDTAHNNLTENHIFQLRCLAMTERKMEFFARLNLRNGPNTAQLTSELHIPTGPHPGEALAEFDLAYATFNQHRVQQVWVDLIFEGVAMNQVVLRDLTLTRHLRAEL